MVLLCVEFLPNLVKFDLGDQLPDVQIAFFDTPDNLKTFISVEEEIPANRRGHQVFSAQRVSGDHRHPGFLCKARTKKKEKEIEVEVIQEGSEKV